MEIELKGGEFEYNIFVYEKSGKLNNIIQTFKLEYEKSLNDPIINSYEYFYELVKQMEGMKVVVTSFGSS